ncbi:MAG: VOC family protein [Clostridiales bacterium]|jgi:uncharacterized glyoxalase superfamily protein PhnB|nr:VOC family protein [Clostridiales bacterium]
MTGVEIDMVVKDSLAAIKVYESIFDVERVAVTDCSVGFNEAVFNIYGSRFHLLDENHEYQLVSPKDGVPKSMWINVVVSDINATLKKAEKSGCLVVQPVTEKLNLGVINALFADPFGYLWTLHQVTREISFDERNEIITGNRLSEDMPK